MRFSRQEYWSGLPCPPPGDRPNPGTEATYPVLAGGFFTTEPPEKPIHVHIIFIELLLCASLWRSWGLGVDNTDILTFSALLEWEGIWMLNKRGRRKTRNWEKQRCSFVSIQISHSTLLPNLDPQTGPGLLVALKSDISSLPGLPRPAVSKSLALALVSPLACSPSPVFTGVCSVPLDAPGHLLTVGL